MERLGVTVALELSEQLEKRGRLQQKALVDFYAFGEYKTASAGQLPSSNDTDTLAKLAAVMQLDDVLVEALNKAAAADHEEARSCLLLNRQRGVELLRKIIT